MKIKMKKEGSEDCELSSFSRGHYTSCMKSVVSLIAFGLILTGCAGTGNRDASMALIRSDVPLKEAGPQQVTPATSTLRRGDRVFVRRVVGDFAEVETMDRRRGYVPTGVLEEQ